MRARGLLAAAFLTLALHSVLLSAATLIVREDSTPLLADCAGDSELAQRFDERTLIAGLRGCQQWIGHIIGTVVSGIGKHQRICT